MYAHATSQTTPLPRIPCYAGDAVERAGPSRQQADLRPPLVVHNPYNSTSSARAVAVTPVAVTPDTAEERRPKPPRPRVSAAPVAARRGPGPFEPKGVQDWEAGEDSGFKQSPSLITVRDVYPPELSRFVRGLGVISLQHISGTRQVLHCTSVFLWL